MSIQIQNPKLVTSYAVPPKSSFSCPPCSLRRKLANGVKRQTFVAVKKDIKAFTEESGAGGTSAPVISSSTYTVDDSKSPTIFVGIVPGLDTEDENTDSFDVLAIHRDGRVRRLSPDLESQRWSQRHSAIAQGADYEVHGCFLLEFDDAKKSLLKRRPDLVSLAAGDSLISGGDDPSILLLVSYPAGAEQISLSEVRIQAFSIPAQVPGRNLDESQQMRHLMTVNLPNIGGERISCDNMNWQFHCGSAGLNLSFEKGFVNFDLSQYTPATTSKFILDAEDFSSVMRISPQTVIGAGKSMIALYDTQYKSIQRSIVTDDLPSTATNSARTTFINYFAKLDLVVATKGNSLLAFDLGSSQSISGIPGKRSRDGLLIDAIGRGIGSASHWEGVSKKHRSNEIAALGLDSSEDIEKWNKFSREVRQCAKNKDGHGFDRAVQAYCGTGDSQAFPSPGQYVNTETALFLISLIFSVASDGNIDKLSASSSINLSVTIWPTQTCEWLISLGLLYPGNVEAALRRAHKPRILPQLPIGTFTKALQDSDPSLQRLISVLQGPAAAFSADELSHALKIFLTLARSSVISTEEDESPKALTNGEEVAANSTTELSQASSSSSTASIQTIFTGVNSCLLKLNAHPHQTTTTSLRASLTRTDLISTIHHLRLSLATGGHTTRFTETPPTPISPALTTPLLPLQTIIALLNAAVDAIGPSGWVSISPADYNTAAASSDPEEAASLRDIALIAEMKSEVSAALAGVEEASLLTGFLREYLRYAKSVDSRALTNTTTTTDEASKLSATTSTAVRHEKLNGADLLVFGAQDADADGEGGDASGKLLPLSLKADKGVSRTKVLKGTGQVVQRSKREMGYLRRKAVGKYTFERLVV